MIADHSPLFAQIAQQIENAIVDGSLAEGEQAPSTNELAAFHRINPATAGKGLNQLVLDGTLHKRRGLGMFVSDGARERLLERRRAAFAQHYLAPAVREARKLGLNLETLSQRLDLEWQKSGVNTLSEPLKELS